MSFFTQTRVLRSSRGENRVSLGSYLMGFVALGRQRAALAKLDQHLLDDIGVGAREAYEESTKPVWNVPGH